MTNKDGAIKTAQKKGREKDGARKPARLSIGIVGPGRAGIALAVALKKSGVRVLGLHGRRRKRVPAGLRLTVGGLPAWLPGADVILLAVQDDQLQPLVAQLAESGGLRSRQVVLHLSGVRPTSSLSPLTPHGVFIGGMHPLMTAMGKPAIDARNLAAATFALEGDVKAVRAARLLVRRLGGRAVRLRAESRPRYHAGAVFAANYVVTMLAVAEDLLVEAGFARRAARAALIPLTGAALANSATNGPSRALTGPIVRGDAATVRLNMRALTDEQRALYRAAGEATLRLAQRAGRVDPARATDIGRVLHES